MLQYMLQHSNSFLHCLLLLFLYRWVAAGGGEVQLVLTGVVRQSIQRFAHKELNYFCFLVICLVETFHHRWSCDKSDPYAIENDDVNDYNLISLLALNESSDVRHFTKDS